MKRLIYLPVALLHVLGPVVLPMLLNALLLTGMLKLLPQTQDKTLIIVAVTIINLALTFAALFISIVAENKLLGVKIVTVGIPAVTIIIYSLLSTEPARYVVNLLPNLSGNKYLLLWLLGAAIYLPFELKSQMYSLRATLKQLPPEAVFFALAVSIIFWPILAVTRTLGLKKSNIRSRQKQY